MLSFFVENRAVTRAILLMACLGVGADAPQATDVWSRPVDAESRLLEQPLLEAGDPEEISSARDELLVIARAARERLDAIGTIDREGLPDSTTAGWLEITIAAYTRALRQEAVRLDRSGADGGEFRACWQEMVRVHLDALETWPRLWKEALVAGPRESHLPERLVLLCSPQAYAGESFELPREALFSRMATLPDSLMRCCIDAPRCVRYGGAGCPEQLAADLARLGDLDALVDFRFGSRYWALPYGVPPRSRANDAAVARAQAEKALEFLRAIDVCMPEGSQSVVTSLSTGSALDRIRSTGVLWPPDLDPFQTVPGLRDPRREVDGRLICDLALYDGCMDALDQRLRARLERLLGPSARMVRVVPDPKRGTLPDSRLGPRD